MTEILAQWFTMMSFHVLAVISPGPDFALILKNSFQYTRKKLIFNSLGIASGVLLHSSYTSVGVSWVSNSSFLQVVYYLGGGYFLYIGIRTLRTILKRDSLSASFQNKSNNIELVLKEKKGWNFPPKKFRMESIEISNSRAFIEGFLCNLLNPKAIPYFLSFYSVFISVRMPYGLLSFYIFSVVVSTFLIFVTLGTFFTLDKVQTKIMGVQKFVSGVMAFVFIGLGLYLWFYAIGF